MAGSRFETVITNKTLGRFYVFDCFSPTFVPCLVYLMPFVLFLRYILYKLSSLGILHFNIDSDLLPRISPFATAKNVVPEIERHVSNFICTHNNSYVLFFYKFSC